MILQIATPNHYPDWISSLVFSIILVVGVSVGISLIIGWIKDKKVIELEKIKNEKEFRFSMQHMINVLDIKTDAMVGALNGAIDKEKYNAIYDRLMSNYRDRHPEMFEK